MGLVADYGSDSDSEGDNNDAGGKVELLSTDDDEEAKGTKRGLEPDTPSPEVTAQQYYAYGGGWYDKAGNYCWVTADGSLHKLRPGATVPEVTGGAGSKKQKTKAGIEEEKMDFPQHKMPIFNAAVLKEIGTKTGAKMRVVEGRIKTGAVKKGIQATLVITGSAAAVKAAKSDAVERLKANAASTVKTEGGKYEFKKKSLYNDGQGGQGVQPLWINGEKPRVDYRYDWRHSGMGWDNGGLTGTDGACGAHCTWKKS